MRKLMAVSFVSKIFKILNFRFGVKYRQSCLIDNIWSRIIQLILIHITLNHLSTHFCPIKISLKVPYLHDYLSNNTQAGHLRDHINFFQSYSKF